MTGLVAAVGVGFVLLALAVYTRGNLLDRSYDHFVWQAAAFLEGQVAIRYPAPAIPGTRTCCRSPPATASSAG